MDPVIFISLVVGAPVWIVAMVAIKGVLMYRKELAVAKALRILEARQEALAALQEIADANGWEAE